MDIRPIASAPQPGSGIAEKAVHHAEGGAPARPSAAPAEAATTVQQPGAIPNLAQLSESVASINKLLRDKTPGLEFEIDSTSQRPIVKVVDMATKEVLRQIPTEEVLELTKAIDQALQGLLIRQNA